MRAVPDDVDVPTISLRLFSVYGPRLCIRRGRRHAGRSLFGVTGIANMDGGNQVSMNQVIATIEQLTGPVQLVWLPVVHGEMCHTGADITLARAAFGYTPMVGLTDGSPPW